MHRLVGIGRATQNNEYFSQTLTWGGEAVSAPLPVTLRSSQSDSRYKYYSINLENTAAVTSVLCDEEIEGVVHLAGALRDSPFKDLINNNVLATHSLLSAMESCLQGGRMILGSSGSVYGNSASIPAVESDRCEPLDKYAVTKLALENLANVSSRQSGYSLAIARIFNVVGPGLDERHLASYLARQFAEQKLIPKPGKVQVGKLSSTRDFVDVRDVAMGLETLLFSIDKQHGNGVFNLASGTELHVQYIYDKLAELSQIKPTSIDMQNSRQLDINRAFANVNRIRTLGFEPIHSINSSLHSLFEYYLYLVSQCDNN